MDKKDIEKCTDIELLVDACCGQVGRNPVLRPVFNGIKRINREQHLPRMYSFPASILYDEHSFSGNPVQKHIELSKLTPMNEATFAEWLSIFTTTVDDLFTGEKANEAKSRAANIARLMLNKIQTA
jgi:hemoglobin